MDGSFCNECGQMLDEPAGLVLAERKPCPNCGSMGRHVEHLETGSLTPTGSLAYEGQKERGSKRWRPWISGWTGRAWTSSRQRWSHKETQIDRRNDLYTERVIDPATGEVIHECVEPLSEHQGHGAAKGTQPRR